MSQVTVNTIKKWTQEECQEKLDEVLPMLIEELNSSDNDENCLDLFALLCQSFIPCVPVQSLESTVFSKILPQIKHVFDNLTAIIKSQLEDKQEVEVLKNLEYLFEVLDCLEKCILHLVLTKQEIWLQYIYSLPIPVLRISLQSFVTFGVKFKTMTTEWKSFVGTESADEGLSERFKILFNKTSSLLKQFLSLWINLKISVCWEDDVRVLATVCGILNDICRTFGSVTGKSPIALWKAYVSTLVKYSITIRDRVDVAPAVNLLCDDVHLHLSEIVAVVSQYETLGPEQEKSIVGSLQICSFNLKIIVNLCEKFKYFLGNCFHSLLHLILTLYSFSTPSLTKPNLPANLEKETERHLAIVIEPLLIQLLDESQFTSLLTNQNLPVFHNVNFCFPLSLLHLFVLGSLPELEDDVQMQLLTPNGRSETNGSLIKMFFTLLPKCDTELSLPVLLPGIMCHGKAQRMVSFYEYMCTKLCGVITILPAKYFSLLERILLEQLLSDNFWQSLLAADVWAFLGRLEMPNLCYDHCCCLAELVSRMDPQHCLVHRCIPLLFRRLFNFLASEHKLKFANQFPPTQYETMWLHLYGLRSSEDSCDRQQLLEVLTKHIDQIKNGLSEKVETNKSWKLLSDMTFSLHILGQIWSSSNLLNFSQTQELLHLCMHVWKYLPLNWDKSSNIDSFICELLALTGHLIPTMQNPHLLQLLNRLALLQCHGTDVVRNSILKIFIPLGTKHILPSPEADIFRLCALLLSNCLQETDAVLLYEGLETFSTFSHTTRHGSIVTQCLLGKPRLLETVKKFLNRVPLEASAKHQDALSILRAQAKFMELKLKATFSAEVSPSSPPAKLPRLHCDSPEEREMLEGSIKEALGEIDEAISKLSIVVSSVLPPPAWLSSDVKSLLLKLENVVPS